LSERGPESQQEKKRSLHPSRRGNFCFRKNKRAWTVNELAKVERKIKIREGPLRQDREKFGKGKRCQSSACPAIAQPGGCGTAVGKENHERGREGKVAG